VWALVGAVVPGLISGCVVVHAVGAVGELVGTTVVVAGKTATSLVKATGKVAGSAISSSGSLTAAGIESLAALAQAGMVTFVDVATGAIVRVPWEQGMSLYGAGALAEVALAKRAIDLVRGGKLVYSVGKQLSKNPTVQPSDVIRLAGKIRR